MLRRITFVFAFGLPAAAQAAPDLTLDGALELARRQGPAARAAGLSIDEARGQLAGAQRLGDNPTVSGALGRRADSGADQVEGQIELVQPLAIGGKRSARIRAAQASVDAETASAELASRSLESEVAMNFYRVLIGQEQGKVARAAEATARRAAEALERRHQLRDVALLDVNLAKGALARASALARTADAELLVAESALKRLLGLDHGQAVRLAGDFRDQRRFSLESLLARAGSHPRRRALIARAAEADAEAAAGRAERWPDVGIGAAYEREEGANVVLGLLSIELPLFDRGQGASAVGQARARRLRFEATAARREAEIAIRMGHAAYRQRLEGVKVLEAAVPLVEATEELARKSYEAGQLSLAEWLVVRREAVETRLDYLEHLLLAAEAGIELARQAGVSP